MKKLIAGAVTAATLALGLGALGASAQAAPAPQLIKADYYGSGRYDGDWRRGEHRRWEARRRFEERGSWRHHHRDWRYDRRW